ncbi:hypothetical protein C2I27_03455 [Priestia megaterium]|uniref:hypothetical protein n=1 Tax=Priestia megaterium TaxID=1404 RepID=UPI000D5089C5|nr:hypothetical protein [Priestia megaterium]PVC74955.1 hypothetical protein C2I27_03455 [Priestia megaterium]
MSEVIEYYSWNPTVHDQLIQNMNNKTVMLVETNVFGTVINVEKKEHANASPIIKVTFEVST